MEKEKNISQEVFDEIEEKKITLKPKWEFLLKNYIFWVVFGLSIIIGSLATAVIILMTSSSEFTVQGLGFAKIIFLNLPYFWLLVMTGFVALAYFNLKHTKKAYKINPLILVFGSVLISVLFGTIIFYLGIGSQVESTVYNKVPIYRQMINHRYSVWMSPENGRIAGVVISPQKDEQFELVDFNGEKWLVITSNDLVKKVELRENMRVKLIGKKIEESKFEATRIMPLFGRGGNYGEADCIERN